MVVVATEEVSDSKLSQLGPLLTGGLVNLVPMENSGLLVVVVGSLFLLPLPPPPLLLLLEAAAERFFCLASASVFAKSAASCASRSSMADELPLGLGAFRQEFGLAGVL